MFSRGVLVLVFLLVSIVNSQNISMQIYDGVSGELVDNFQNWSWGTVNLRDTTVVRPGSKYSCSLVVNNYEAAYFHGDFYMNVARLPYLSFWINGGPQGGQSVNLHVTSHQAPIGNGVSIQTLLGTNIPANQWVLVRTDFSIFQTDPGVMLDGIQFQAGTSGNQGSIYLDNINFNFTLPSPAPVTLTIPNTGRKAVSQYIYGVNFATAAQISSMKYPVNRWGGNAVTRYNYLIDAENHASDWYFEDIPNDVQDVSKLPDGSQSYNFVKDALTNGAKVLLTTPTIGWRPFDRQKRCGFSVSKYGTQQQTDPYDSDCGNGVKPDGTFITGNDPHDTSVETDGSFNVDWIKYLDKTFGNGAVRWFQMDNEPGLWHQTHRDVHPKPLTYDELWNRTLVYGSAIKQAFPDSLIFGPISWGWCAYMYSPADNCADGSDRKAHGDLPLIQWYIQQSTDYQKSTGKKLVDVIDVHFYPQANGVFSNKEDPITALLRLRSPRGLWDPNYVDESWINQPIMILQRINDWINAINPGGFYLALSEYNYGDDTLITSALAQVDNFGILARQNVHIATRWVVPNTGSIAEDAFKLFLNYDGQGSGVSGDSLDTKSSESELVTVYGYDNSQSKMLYVVYVNKVSSGSVPLTIDVSAFVSSGTMTFYGFQKGIPLRQITTSNITNGKVQISVAAWSAGVGVVKYT